MWKLPAVLAVGLVLVGTVGATGTVSVNERPLADAGLDQEVTKGATVLLDGTGSRDPDGEISTHEWSIRTPNGRTITPDCADCARTEFEPSEVGRYRVTLTVTDDDGATSSDTLYVDVSPGVAPDVSLSGPETVTAGDTATYTANFDPGAAALDYVVWTVDGAEFANHSLSGDQGSDSATKRFPTAGSRTVTATVYDVDGQSSTDSFSVTIRRPTEPSNPSSDQPPLDRSTIADRTSPTVSGDDVVTGSEPLRGQYEVELDAAAERIRSVEWRDVRGAIGEGRSLTHAWDPGDHELYALVTYVDGSQNVATFADGTTTVVADPRPDPSAIWFNRFGVLSGAVSSFDGYENLASLRVEIDGRTVATARRSIRDDQLTRGDRRQTLRFSFEDFEAGKQYTVTVIATDERGQTGRFTRDIVPVRRPEIVRSEFVNDPVDSYHERIDADRYAARHVLEIDLNGVDPGNVSVSLENGVGVKRLEGETTTNKRIYYRKNNTILVRTSWAGPTPGFYEVDAEYNLKIKKTTWWTEETSRFRVHKSQPELRMEVLNDGTEKYLTKNHGMLVDASESFDPDGTRLEYIWWHGAEPTKPDNTTAKFDSYERAALTIEDQYDLSTNRSFDFLDYFVPDIKEVTVLSEEPHYSNDTVRVRVRTEAYDFSKRTYHEDFALGVSVSSSKATVVRWELADIDNLEHRSVAEDPVQYIAIIELPASELSPSRETPTVTVYNEANERKTAQMKIPNVNVLVKQDTYLQNVTISGLKYVIKKPEIREVTVDSEDELTEFLIDGYTIDETRQRTEYTLESREKVRDAVYETVTKEFKSQQARRVFLETRSDWRPAGTFNEEVTRTGVRTEWYDASTVESNSEWHDSNPWNGESTGRTRRVVADPAEFRTERLYSYERQVRKTGTRTVTKSRTISVARTGTRTVTECTYGFGCYETTETYTYYTTKTVTYTTTETYTYTVTRTETYWSTRKHDHSHEFTGETRRIKVKDAEYETQHEIQWKEEYTETVTRYEAERDELVRPAQYEWTTELTTDELLLARQYANANPDWRIGSHVTKSEWILTKRVGTLRYEARSFKNESYVERTTALVSGRVTEEYYDAQANESVTITKGIRAETYNFGEALSKEQILEEVVSSNKNNT